MGRTGCSLSAPQGSVPVSEHAPQHPPAETPPPKKKRKSGQKAQGVSHDSTPGSANPSGRAKVARSSKPSQVHTLSSVPDTTSSPVSLTSTMPAADREGQTDLFHVWLVNAVGTLHEYALILYNPENPSKPQGRRCGAKSCFSLNASRCRRWYWYAIGLSNRTR
jgi:hypothetical protein